MSTNTDHGFDEENLEHLAENAESEFVRKTCETILQSLREETS